jgi:hypothetical protein
MKLQLGVDKYSKVCYTVGPGYRRLAKLIIIKKCVSFPGKRYDLSFTDVEFHTVSNAPTLCSVYVRLEQIAVVRRINGTINFDIVSKD